MKAKQLRAAMNEAKFTNYMLADFLGIKHNSVSRYLRGVVPIPAAVDTLFVIITRCNVRGIDWRPLFPDHVGGVEYEEHRRELARLKRKRAAVRRKKRNEFLAKQNGKGWADAEISA